MKIKLSDYPTFNKDWDKQKTEKKTDKMLKRIGELQHKMFAQNKYSLLIVLQGTDASGKDGLTKGLLKYCNPIGFEVDSFKKPSEEEYAHDFLWRIHKVSPRKGTTHVFIRSHYEDIIVPTIEKYIAPEVIEKRYRLINEFEKILEHNDTKVLKFFMNVSKKAQEERLLERIELKEKHWKHKDGDWDTREKFDEYLDVYEKIISNCSEIPWNIIPSDKNWQKLHAAAEVVLKTLEELDLKWPELITERFTREK
ncbi:MAG: polyphosphate kinase [Bacteroidales bacterium]|nr:polyphosphate kinase [Bacteroidales bacterium]